MKKSEFIQILEKHQPEETKVMGFLLFKGQDSDALRQLKSILKHPQVYNLPNEAQLPSAAIEAVKKVLHEATNVDSRTKRVLDSLRQLLPQAVNTAESASNSNSEVSTNSKAVTVVSAASSTKAGPAFDPSQSDFWYTHTLLSLLIFNALPTEAEEEQARKNQPQKKWNPYSRRAFFRVFTTTNKEGFEPVRQGVLNGMQEQFLKNVADAEMKSAEAILKLAMVNEFLLRKLLTTKKTIIQKNGIPVTGTALEIAYQCWDWSSCEGGQEEMAEMLMRTMRLLPDGEKPIQTTFTKLFPNGHKVHQEEQINRADEFAQSILEPLAETIRTASDADIQLVYALTAKQDNEVDSYIENTLANNPFWKKLMVHHEAIKEFMIKDNVYNPLYLEKAFEIVKRKYEKENWWRTLSKGLLTLLTIHGVGGIQACSPTIVGMLFARGGIWDFDDLKEAPRKAFKVDRDCKFDSGGGDVFARSGGGVLLCSKKFWARWRRAELGWVVTSSGFLKSICQTKTQHLEASLRVYFSAVNNESVCNAIAPR